MDTLYTCWDHITHCKTESVDFLGLLNSATKKGGGCSVGDPASGLGFRNGLYALAQLLPNCIARPPYLELLCAGFGKLDRKESNLIAEAVTATASDPSHKPLVPCNSCTNVAERPAFCRGSSGLHPL